MYNLFDDNGASFSDCKRYRYCLWRIWDKELPRVMFVGLNPSTANETEPDATIRRVVSFAKKWGYGGVYMLNVFPYVSTDPDDMVDFYNTNYHLEEAEKNDKWLWKIGNEVTEIILAWGNFDVAKVKGEDISRCFKNANCLIKNKNGSPRHPLYVPLSVKRIPFK